jgi:hypothetical protein
VKRNNNIRASELSQWCFCPRQWYLFRTTGRKVMTPSSKRGIDFHVKESQKVEAVKSTQWVFATILIIGGMACIIWLLS